jgi:small conductance mechanosensitive channel
MAVLLQIKTDSIAQRFTGKAYNWIVDFGPKLLIAIVLFVIGQWVIKLINGGLSRILSNKRFDATLRPFIQNLLQITLQVLLVLGLMQVLGIQMTLFAAVLGAFGVAIGLSLSGTMQNFASGVLIILLKPFRVGDNIKTQGEEGTVTSIRLFYTVIRTFNNTTLIVPNSKLSNEVIFNLTREKKRRMDIVMKFTYGVDFKKLQSVVLKMAAEFDQCLKDPPPRIGIEKIETDGYTVVINIWTSSHGYHDTVLAFNERLLNELKPFFTKSIENSVKPMASTKN